jgi:L-lactate utilization protein LutB
MTERDWYYLTKMRNAARALEKNGMDAYIAETAAEARKKALSLIRQGATVGIGGSRSAEEIGLLDALRSGDYNLFDQYAEGLSEADSLSARKEGTHAEYFVSGTNAVTEDGKLVNTDGLGNRLAGFCFGPEKIVIVVGRNKVVPDVESAIERVRNVAAPMNAKRFGLSTPCVKTGTCSDCNSPERICNLTLVIEKQRVKGRISVILVNEELGF